MDVEQLLGRLEQMQAQTSHSPNTFATCDVHTPPVVPESSATPPPGSAGVVQEPTPSNRSKVSWLRSPFGKHQRAHSEEPRREQNLPTAGDAESPAGTANDGEEEAEAGSQGKDDLHNRGRRSPGKRVRSLSPFSGRAWVPSWRIPQLALRKEKAQQGETADTSSSAEDVDFEDSLLQSLRRSDAATPVQEQQPVFARVGPKWERGVVVNVESTGDQQRIQVRVKGVLQGLSRDQVRVPVKNSSTPSQAAATLASADSCDDWTITELVSSLKLDDKSQALGDSQQVFARVQGKWQSGTVIMSREETSGICYTIKCKGEFYDLNRQELCARVAPESASEDLDTDLPADAESAVADDLAQSLRSNKKAASIAEQQPVFAKVGGDWQMGVVVNVRNEGQQMMYSVRLQHEVHDLVRDDLCPRVKGPKKLRGLPRWPQGIFSKFQRPKSSTPVAGSGTAAAADSAELPQNLPSAAEALSQTPERQDSAAAPVGEAVHTNLEEGTYDVFDDQGVQSQSGMNLHVAQFTPQRASGPIGIEGSTVQSPPPPTDMSGNCAEPLLAGNMHHMYSSQKSGMDTISEPSGLWPRTSPEGVPTTGQLAQDTHSRASFALCVSVHNGIQTVGRELVSTACDLRCAEEEQWATIQCTELLSLDWVPQDSCCNILVELRQLDVRFDSLRQGGCSILAGSKRIAWAIVVPYQEVLPHAAHLNCAPQLMAMQTGPGIDPRGHPLFSLHACMADACIQNGMLQGDTCELVACIPQLNRIQPPIHMGVSLREGCNPRPPSPQPPVFTQSPIFFGGSPTEVTAADYQEDQAPLRDVVDPQVHYMQYSVHQNGRS